MKPKSSFLVLLAIIAVLYMVSFIMEFELLYWIANILLIPAIMLFYVKRAEIIRWPIIVSFVLFFVRDVYIRNGYTDHPVICFVSFYLAVGILIMYALTEFQRTKIKYAEFLSFAIIYGFSIFLFYSLAETVPEVLPNYKWPMFLYLLLLVLFLSIGFTVYFLKAHKASLWLMLISSSLAFSEACLFLKFFVVDDLSVNIFYPLFHVLAYFSIAMFALHRRYKKNWPH